MERENTNFANTYKISVYLQILRLNVNKKNKIALLHCSRSSRRRERVALIGIRLDRLLGNKLTIY